MEIYGLGNGYIILDLALDVMGLTLRVVTKASIIIIYRYDQNRTKTMIIVN